MRGGAASKRGSGKHNPAPSNTTTALAGVNVIYCAETAQARRLLGEMTASGQVAVDLETAPNKTEIDRLAKLLQREGGDGRNAQGEAQAQGAPRRARGAGRRRQAPRRRNSIRPDCRP